MKQRSLIILGALLLTCFLAACGASPGNTAEKTSGISVPVRETDFHIDSAVISFSPGTRYHFVVTNNGKTAHEFMIMPSSQGSMSGMSMGDMDSMGLCCKK